MVDTAIGPKIVPVVLRKALLSWYALMVMAIGVVLAGVGLFWYREEIAARYYEAQYKTLTALGLGIAPVVLWLSIFTFAMVKKPLWFLKWKLWVASVFLIAFTIAAMAFRQPFEGPLAFFTMDGDVSLGGAFGSTLIGQTAALDVVRAAALLLAALVIAAPAVALGITVLTGRAVRVTYFYTMIVLRGIGSLLRSAFHLLGKLKIKRKKRTEPADLALMESTLEETPDHRVEEEGTLVTRPSGKNLDAYSIIANSGRYPDAGAAEGDEPEDSEELPERRGAPVIVGRDRAQAPVAEPAYAGMSRSSAPASTAPADAPPFLSQSAAPAPAPAYEKKIVPEIIRNNAPVASTAAPVREQAAPVARPTPSTPVSTAPVAAPARPQPAPSALMPSAVKSAKEQPASRGPSPFAPMSAGPQTPVESAKAEASSWAAPLEEHEGAPKHPPMGTIHPAAPVPTSGLPTIGAGHAAGHAKMHTPVTPNVASTKGTSALPDLKGVTASADPNAPAVVAKHVVATPKPTSVLPDLKGITNPHGVARTAAAATGAATTATSGGIASVVAAQGAPAAGVAPAQAKEEDDSEDTTPAILRTPELGNAKFNRFWNSSDDVAASKDVSPEVALEVLQEDLENDGADIAKIVEEAVAVHQEARAHEPLPVLQSQWDLPPIDIMIRSQQGGISDEQMLQTADNIKRALAEYGVDVEVGEIRPGPTVTMYGLVPGWIRKTKQVRATDQDGNLKTDDAGKTMVQKVETKMRVKVDAITAREKDLSLALKTPSLRIETPVMGKSLIGIEVPNPKATLVSLRTLMETDQFHKLRETAKLPVAIGKGSGGETVIIDLARMPHLLVAGATGSGKSVFINTLISCLLMERSPAELRLLLIDPKRVELTPYNGIPHLLTPVIVETDQVVGYLKGMIREMFDRYRRFEEVGAKNIDTYNNKMPLDKLPYLVVAIDELADLMMTASMEVEQAICRLAQLGRATGIHLVVATQRPSVDVVTGLIKANFPSRVSFAVTSQIDSRTILDMAGAEKLLGKGDMLYQAIDAPRPERVQGVYISDKEVEDLVKFWQSTPRAPMPEVFLHSVGDPGMVNNDDDGEDEIDESKDALIDKAIEIARHHKKLSTSLLQRRMRIGYPRAARLMDQLEDAGIVGPSDGSKSRDVIINAT